MNPQPVWAVGFLTLTKQVMKTFRPPAWFVLLGCGILLAPGINGLAESQVPQQTTSADAAPARITDAEKSEAKAIFAGQCGWCHGDYGMKGGKGPRLAGTEMTEQQVEERIRNGKSGYMPSFRQFLNDAQIAAMAKYIKSLKPED